MSSKQTKFKIFSIAFGIIIGLLVVEIGLRVNKYFTFQNLDNIDFGNRSPIDLPEEELTLGQMIQISSHRKIIYELIPNSTYQFKNVKVQTNDQGFKDKNYPPQKDNNTKRIIGIGDSGMFGWGVSESDCYISQLENQLNQSDSFNYEIINTSVPGYNTVMEVAVLENKIDLNQVDLVIIDFISNDFELPSFIRKQPNFWTTQKSFILMFFEENYFSKKISRDQWLNSSPVEDGYFLSDPEKVPEAYRDMVGTKSYVSAMKRLKELSEEFDFQIIVMSQSPFLKVPKIVTQTCEDLDLDFIDFAPHWKDYKTQNPNARWKLSEDDWHPTAEGHYQISKILFKKIKTLKL